MEIKFNHPRAWHHSVQGLKSNYLQHTPGGAGIWKEARFFINDATNHCDIWVVQGDLDAEETVYCKGPTVFVLSEEAGNKMWDPRFLQQFDLVIGSQEKITHQHYKRGQYLCPWQIDKSYDELRKLQTVSKEHDLSAVVSDSTFREGHKKRFAFVNQLKGHFKDRLHWYGRGNIYLENKWDGLAPYKYSIAIENSTHVHYWTEKIADCFLAYTLPIYYGCSNIEEYFPPGSFIPININDLKESVSIIEQAIAENWYENNFTALAEARQLVLEEYQFFPGLLQQLAGINLGAVYEKKVLKPEQHIISRKSMLHYVKRAVQLIRE